MKKTKKIISVCLAASVISAGSTALAPMVSATEISPTEISETLPSEGESVSEATDPISVATEESSTEESSVAEESSIETSTATEESVSATVPMNSAATTAGTEAVGNMAIAPAAATTLDQWMPDPALQEEVARHLNVTTAEITPELMATLTDFNVYNPGITNLTGLEQAVNLQSIALYGLGIDLTNFNLGVFSQLKSLNLDSFSATTFDLTGLQSLEHLWLQRGNVSELKVTGLSQLKDMSLGVMSLPSLSLDGMTSLEYFNLSQVKIPILSLSGATNLSSLSFNQTKLGDLVFSNMARLGGINLYGDSTIKNITIKDMPELYNVSFSSLTALQSLVVENSPNLSYVSATNNTMTKATFKNLPLLNGIYLDSNKLTQMQLVDLPQLQSVNLSNNCFTDLRNLTRTNVNPAAIYYLQNQSLVSPDRSTINTPVSLPALFAEDGTPISWTLSGTAEVDYHMDSPTSVVWLTAGYKQANATYSSNNFEYSASYNSTILGAVDEWVLLELDPYSSNLSSIISNTFVRNGMNFSVDSGVTNYSAGAGSTINLNENHRITNLNTEDKYTYTYHDGNGYYSNLWYNLDGSYYQNFSYSAMELYMKVDGSGRESLKKVYHTTLGLDITIVTWVTAEGEIRHSIEVDNVSGADISNLSLLTRIDTELNLNDAINIYATGSGGVYMKGDDIVLYGEPLEGTSRVYAGHYNVMSQTVMDSGTGNATTAFGKAPDQIMAENVDSGMYFGPAVQNLTAGTSLTFSYQERVFSTAEPPPKPNNSVTVSYVTEDGTALDEVILVGNPNDPYATEEKSFSDYELVKVDGSTTGSFTYDPQSIVYTYRLKDGADITVKFLNEQGQELAPAEILKGQVTTGYLSSAKTLEGFELIRVEGNPQGTFTYDPQQISYIYRPKATILGQVFVHYVDENGAALAESQLLTGDVGETYQTLAQAITGYSLQRVEGNQSGSFTAAAQTVIYHYHKSEVSPDSLGGDVTVNYVDQDGKALSESVVLKGLEVGKTYQTEKKAFDGYTFVKVDGQENGSFSSEAQSVTYHYQKTEGALTKTGEKAVEHALAGAVGAGALLAIATFIFRRRKQRDN